MNPSRLRNAIMRSGSRGGRTVWTHLLWARGRNKSHICSSQGGSSPSIFRSTTVTLASCSSALHFQHGSPGANESRADASHTVLALTRAAFKTTFYHHVLLSVPRSGARNSAYISRVPLQPSLPALGLSARQPDTRIPSFGDAGAPVPIWAGVLPWWVHEPANWPHNRAHGRSRRLATHPWRAELCAFERPSQVSISLIILSIGAQSFGPYLVPCAPNPIFWGRQEHYVKV